MLDAWLAVQRQWLYLQPIFHTRDIQQQRPLEIKRFKTVHRLWRNTMTMVHTHRHRQTLTLTARSLLFVESREWPLTLTLPNPDFNPHPNPGAHQQQPGSVLLRRQASGDVPGGQQAA